MWDNDDFPVNMQKCAGPWSVLVRYGVFAGCPSAGSRCLALEWRHNERESVSNHLRLHCLLNHLFRRRSKKTSMLRVTDLCERKTPVTGEFPALRPSNAENVSIWWRHHEKRSCDHNLRTGCWWLPPDHRNPWVVFCVWLADLGEQHCIRYFERSLTIQWKMDISDKVLIRANWHLIKKTGYPLNRIWLENNLVSFF